MTNSSAPASRSTARQLRRRRMQREIAATALELFAAEGYEQITVDAIAAASLISSRTFYRYFPAKEDLIFHGIPDAVELLRREAQAQQGALLNRLRYASVRLAEVFESERDTWISRFKLILSVPSLRARNVVLNDRYEDVFYKTIREESPASAEAKRHSRLLAGAIMGGMQTAVKVWVAGGGKPSLPSLANAVFDAFASTGVKTAEKSLLLKTAFERPITARKKGRPQDIDWASWMDPGTHQL